MKTLVIVESPTKAKTIGKMLGRNYTVVASKGHLRDLPKSTLGVDIENHFEPRYITIRGKAPIVRELKKEAKKHDRVLLATDPDREGEAISFHLSELLGLPEEKNRVAFHEITKEAVKEGVKHPRELDRDLFDAQQARRVLDRLVGYQISPLLWQKIQGGLSAGRVQSAVLKLICDREEEIRAFVPEEYWNITAEHRVSKIKFTTSLTHEIENGNAVPIGRIANEKEARSYYNRVDQKHFVVTHVEESERKRRPPMPFTTSTLQQDASRKLGMSTRKTMQVAQSLYEGISIGSAGAVGLITYMRTDSTRLSEQSVASMVSWIKEHLGSKYASAGRKYGRTGKNTQDAHEAIRPSDISRTPESVKDYLSKDEWRLYELIWMRTLASQMTPSISLTKTIDLQSNDLMFHASGSVQTFDGFQKIYSGGSEANPLPDLKEGDIIEATTVEMTQHFTQPKPRYNEASLIKLLESLGIGRPSTYAPTIGTIQARGYVKNVKKTLEPTELGETVNDILSEYFPRIVDADFTANMETELDSIADGQMDWKDSVEKFYRTFEEELVEAQEKIKKLEPYEEKTDEICPRCGKPLVIKRGRFGKFMACSGYPDCNYTKSIVKEIGVACPRCGAPMVERKSKRGRIFYGCSAFPKCNFVSWDRPTGEKCPKCGSLLAEKHTKTIHEKRCLNDTCDFKEKIKEV